MSDLKTYGLSTLPAAQRVAWRTLAIEVFREHDRVFSDPASSRSDSAGALRRLRAALPSLRQMMNDAMMEVDDRAYVEELVNRVERACLDHPEFGQGRRRKSP
jgi:hypothetical protein